MASRIDINYRHLFYFWSVAKEGHLTKVARQLRISQSALSIQIKQLEQSLGMELFLRDSKRLSLTEAGRVVVTYADGIFDLGSQMLAALRVDDSSHLRRIRIGAMATLSRNFQENFLSPLLKESNIQFILESGSFDELLSELQVHKLDLVLANRPISADSQQPWRCRRIARQPVCLVGGDKALSKKFIFPSSLDQQKVLLPGRNSDIRTGFDQICEDYRLTVQVLAEVDDMAMLRLLARDSGAIALVPEVVVQDELRNKLLYKYCVVPKLYENFYAITVERHTQSEVVRLLLSAAGIERR